MSITKRFMELQQEEDNIRAILVKLINDQKLTHSAAIGIAEKIIADGNLDGLSEKQKTVFDRYIAPEMKIKCELCDADIPRAAYAEVITNAQVEGMVLCDGCLSYRMQMRKD